MPPELIWLILLLPFLSFVIIGFVLRSFLNDQPKLGGYTAIAAVFSSFLLSIWVLLEVWAAPGHELMLPDVTWLVIENGVTIQLGLMVDSLSAVMLIVVTVVSLMVLIYSQGYMRGDPGYHRYFAWMSLFTMAMLGVVLADSLLLVFVFWELVGLCSYLLIGFWFHKPAARNAATKAFVVTRLGDFGFLAAILILFLNTGTFDISELQHLAVTGVLAGSVLTWAAIGIFAGAVGKSAQFPLHVWLPDAMEGPTPVSALIHAAAMVAAGVFLVARTFPLFEPSLEAMTTVDASTVAISTPVSPIAATRSSSSMDNLCARVTSQLGMGRFWTVTPNVLQQQPLPLLQHSYGCGSPTWSRRHVLSSHSFISSCM